MPDLPTHPMQDAVAGLIQAFDGLHGALGSIDANRPAKDASYDAQVAFLDALRPVVAEAQLSLALVSGHLASCLRAHRASLN